MTSKPFLVRRHDAVDLVQLARMPPAQLQRLYKDVFGAPAPNSNSEFARRKIAWQVQAEREGGLPESARQRAMAIARDNLRRVRGKRPAADRASVSSSLPSDYDSRIPMPGSVLVKDYRGRRILVRVLTSGFEWEGRHFPSLSSLAKAITGTKWNGLLFFGLTKGGSRGQV